MRGRQVLMETLVNHGVDRIFGNPGTTESPLLPTATLARPGRAGAGSRFLSWDASLGAFQGVDLLGRRADEAPTYRIPRFIAMPR